jgi:hypothetical protein
VKFFATRRQEPEEDGNLRKNDQYQEFDTLQTLLAEQGYRLTSLQAMFSPRVQDSSDEDMQSHKEYIAQRLPTQTRSDDSIQGVYN